jgi:hypothetical protein
LLPNQKKKRARVFIFLLFLVGYQSTET